MAQKTRGSLRREGQEAREIHPPLGCVLESALCLPVSEELSHGRCWECRQGNPAATEWPEHFHTRIPFYCLSNAVLMGLAPLPSLGDKGLIWHAFLIVSAIVPG
jgi:hypothetical protein